MPVRKNVFSIVADLNRLYVPAEPDASGRPFLAVGGAAWLNARLVNSVLTGDFSEKSCVDD